MTTVTSGRSAGFVEHPLHTALADLEPTPAIPGEKGGIIVGFRAPFDGLRVVMASSGYCELQRLAYNPSFYEQMLITKKAESILRYWPARPIAMSGDPIAVARAVADDLARVQSKPQHLQVIFGTPEDFLALLDALAILASTDGRLANVDLRCETTPGKRPSYARIRHEAEDLPSDLAATLLPVLEAASFEFMPSGWTQEMSSNGLVKRDGLRLARKPPPVSAHQRMAATSLVTRYAREAHQRLCALPKTNKRAAEIVGRLAASGLLGSASCP